MTIDKHSIEALQQFIDQAYAKIRAKRAPASAAFSAITPLDPTPPPLVPPDPLWVPAQEAFDQGATIQALVTGWNRGGLLVRWDELQGFIPISQLRQVPITDDDDLRDEALAHWVGEVLDLRIIELDPSRNRLVFSERATRWSPQKGEELLHDLEIGQVRSGVVSNICPFGVFVDLGGIDGLVHISELSWGRVTQPQDLLNLGDKVQVHILSIDRHYRRVALSIKQLLPNPWATIDTRYQIGQITMATVTNLVAFGAFAQIEEGVEGLIHISELSDARVLDPGQMVRPGDEVLVRILRIDSQHHRLGLSMRQVDPASAREWGLDAEMSTDIPPRPSSQTRGDIT